MTDRFDTVLIANRGEIACRVIRTAKALGYRTVAIASEADRSNPHAALADHCEVIGPALASQSYLDQDRILDAARRTGAQAIHPGYGFLSENAAFARAVREAGLVFIGPSAEAIELMGDKARAKRAMIDAGVPCIPGYQGTDQSDETLIAAARDAGLPVMVKAAAGGGGKGMRLVNDAERLADALRDARREAEAAFGSGDLIIEKAITGARHVEIQVFGDAHGTILHLGERDCSLQRRHQKVIEEAPSPAVDRELRNKMGAAAVAAAAAVDYTGAGTVEFLLARDGAFYFLEMNTRLQVEHPVTEEITGLDLVALQLQVAQGDPLGFSQDDVRLDGHAIEARLYAEDPAQGFLPASGPVKLFRPPDGLRVDAGITAGGDVSPHYDPMVAKVIARGRTRDEARRKLAAGLRETGVLGFTTNRIFLADLLDADVFVRGDADTNTIDSMPAPEAAPLDHRTLALAAALQFRTDCDAAYSQRVLPDELRGWQPGYAFPVSYAYEHKGEDLRLTVSGQSDHPRVTVGGDEVRVDNLTISGGRGQAVVDGRALSFSYVIDGPEVLIGLPDKDVALTNLLRLSASAAAAQAEGVVTAPMHGLITDVLCREGEKIEKGQRLAVLEAMKMQHAITAPIAGTVSSLSAKAGEQAAAGDILLVIEPDTEESS